MKKYILISLLFHLSFFFIFKTPTQLGNENLTKIVPITFVTTKTSENPGSRIVVSKEVEKKEIVKPKEKKKEKKIEKKEIKSKIADKKEKKEETVLEVAQEQSATMESIKNTGESEENGEISAFQGSNFMSDGDGGYIALSSAGIYYEILNEVEPEYPTQAEMIGYGQRVKVKVKFLVGLNGEIEKIEILESHQKLGFDEEVKKAIKKWRFKPIIHHGKNIKVYFVKDFVFNPR